MVDLPCQYSPSFSSSTSLPPSAQGQYCNLAEAVQPRCRHCMNTKEAWSQRHFLQRLSQLMFLGWWYRILSTPYFLQLHKLLFFLSVFTPFFLPVLSCSLCLLSPRSVTTFYPKYVLTSFNSIVLSSSCMIAYDKDFFPVSVKWARKKLESSQCSRPVFNY